MGAPNMTVDRSPDPELGWWEVWGVGPAHRQDCELVVDLTVAWASCSGPRGSQRRWGEGMHTVTAAGRNTLSPYSCRAQENHLCHSGEEGAWWERMQAPTIVIITIITVYICWGLCHLLKLFPGLFTITYQLGKLLLLGLGRRKWKFSEVK